jgi:hypothetical protein
MLRITIRIGVLGGTYILPIAKNGLAALFWIF